MRSGYYSDKYFVRAREVLLADGYRPRVTMQVFGKQHAFLGGVDEAIAILKLCAIEWPELEVQALYDGDEVEPWETVMLINGPYDAFAHLETLYLGVLARRTRVGTNTRRVVEAGAPEAGDVLPGPARPLAGADRRRLRGAYRRGHRRLHRRAGLLVGQRGDRHRAARPDRGLRRRHGARHGASSSSMSAAGRPGGDAGGLRERLREDLARGGRAPSATGSTACGSTPAKCWWTSRCCRRWAGSGPPG